MSMISISIDLSKVDKNHFHIGKKGAKYLNILVMERRDGPGQYGDTHLVVQQVSKEERLRGVKGPILGNGKVLGGSGGQNRSTGQRSSNARPSSQTVDDPEGDVPF